MASVAPGSTQVLIAGGGPVGLATAIELGRRDVDCLVVEPRVTVSRARPRCKTVNVRTLEHLRRWGIAERLRERAPLPVSWSKDIVFCTSLTGHELSRFTGVLGLAADGDRFAETGQQAPQYVLEELLRDVADELPTVSLARGYRVLGLEQDEGEVRVAIAAEGGEESMVSADFVVGCDGARSVVRAAIGSDYVGEHALRPNLGMVFRAPALLERVRHGPAVQYWIVNRSAPGLMGPIDLQGTWWMIAFGVDCESGERDAQQIIEGCAGEPVEAAVVSTDGWTARMQLVDSARRGRVFLAGDAAHLNPPFGGHGLNTGVGDSVDLGWKLAAVLKGWGGPGLLDSYELERRPVQTQVIEAAAANNRVLAADLLADEIDAEGAAGERARRAADANIQDTKNAEFHALDLVLDLAYDGSPIISANGSSPDPVTGGRDGAVVGARLPHAWLAPGQSLFDALGDGMSLLVLAEDRGRDVESLAAAARSRGVPLRVIGLEGRDLRPRYGSDLVLVRPDQHVAWRADHAPAEPARLIDRVRGMDRGTP